MELYKYIPYNTFKNLIVPPPPLLTRSYIDIPGSHARVWHFHQRRLMTELRNVFSHLSEVKYNKLIKKSYVNMIDLIFKNKYKINNIGRNQSRFIKNIISNFILNVNDTRYTI